jgi:hypothetical protein
MMHLEGQSNLFHVVLALRATRRFTSRLHRWQQQRHQHADNGDDHQEFNKREPAFVVTCHVYSSWRVVD